MPTPQETLQAILARKPDHALLGRSAAPVPEPVAEPPLPEPAYTEHRAPLTECRTWLEQSRLYALIDGLDLPDLPGQIAQRHPNLDTALYDAALGGHHEMETPRFVRLDAELMAWLQPVMEADPGWGWCMVLRDDLAALGPDAALEPLLAHFRPQVWVHESPHEPWVFRLHDPRVLANWLHCAPDRHIEHFLRPLRHVLIHEADAIRVLTPHAGEAPVEADVEPEPWPEEAFLALHRMGKEDLLLRLQTHLRAQHPGVRDWPDDRLRPFIMEHGNRAVGHGFQNEQAMGKFLSLCVLLGPDFDIREDGAWARQILEKPSVRGQRAPIDQLVQGALQRLDAAPDPAS